MNTFVDDVLASARQIQASLALDPVVGGLIDSSLDIPRPFMGDGDIRLVIIGQDPTVQREESRRTIQTVLNLDKPGALRAYVEALCKSLGLELDRNVYATNLAKGFFVEPPTRIMSRVGRDVLVETAPSWLPLLRAELEHFPAATVISLGEPVLRVLVGSAYPQQMRHYWGWRSGWRKSGARAVYAVAASESTIGRRFFPFVHQPTARGARTAFYRWRRDAYTAFIRDESSVAHVRGGADA